MLARWYGRRDDDGERELVCLHKFYLFVYKLAAARSLVTTVGSSIGLALGPVLEVAPTQSSQAASVRGGGKVEQRARKLQRQEQEASQVFIGALERAN